MPRRFVSPGASESVSEDRGTLARTGGGRRLHLSSDWVVCN